MTIPAWLGRWCQRVVGFRDKIAAVLDYGRQLVDLAGIVVARPVESSVSVGPPVARAVSRRPRRVVRGENTATLGVFEFRADLLTIWRSNKSSASAGSKASGHTSKAATRMR